MAYPEASAMCLGIPGKLLDVYQKDDLPMGKADFGGVVKEVCLAYTPEAQPGEYVLVHVGFAISRIDQAEADEIFSMLAQMEASWTESEEQATPDARSP
ncbi:MAG TPA: HypC/HybG/HupF family hydrogenase formation chaperone [Thermoguttaceae bacterium]|nr:HypC/HybG/HupF family hydrogenase formation chaperone [Thermoguttaceae bacterium]HPP54432.1 HypC/HybG/HupF family hydrogenase formation chaperone [Thermoguttaceae bacterium]